MRTLFWAVVRQVIELSAAAGALMIFIVSPLLAQYGELAGPAWRFVFAASLTTGATVTACVLLSDRLFFRDRIDVPGQPFRVGSGVIRAPARLVGQLVVTDEVITVAGSTLVLATSNVVRVWCTGLLTFTGQTLVLQARDGTETRIDVSFGACWVEAVQDAMQAARSRTARPYRARQAGLA
jgi:hypothetical protein